MRYIKFFIIIFFLFSFQLTNAFENNLNSKITKNLRCLICQGQSIYDSDSEFANSIKILVSQKLDQGLSEKEIYSFLKNKYGEWIVYDPEFNSSTFLLWGIPLILFIFGGLLIIRKVFINW